MRVLAVRSAVLVVLRLMMGVMTPHAVSMPRGREASLSQTDPIQFAFAARNLLYLSLSHLSKGVGRLLSLITSRVAH